MRLRTLLFALLAFPLAASAQHDDIVDIASANDDFSTLVAAVQTAGLVETLKSDGPFTVFAPTNVAFADLGNDTVRSLLRPENRDRLTAILTYHVVPGRFSSAELGALDALTTVNGQTLQIGRRVNDSRLVATDIEASNGIIHVIDAVLVPREPRRSSSHH